MPISIDFSKARKLKIIYKKKLLENYDYENSYKASWFDPIDDSFAIEKVKIINNPELYGMYLLWKEELQNSSLYEGSFPKAKILYHATSRENAKSIARSNIDWRKTVRSRFGMGACFSPSPIYANRFAGSKGAFVIFKVLTKNIETVDVDYSLRLPTEKKYDTTLSKNGMVFVKYDDYQFYPKFIVYY